MIKIKLYEFGELSKPAKQYAIKRYCLAEAVSTAHQNALENLRLNLRLEDLDLRYCSSTCSHCFKLPMTKKDLIEMCGILDLSRLATKREIIKVAKELERPIDPKADFNDRKRYIAYRLRWYAFRNRNKKDMVKELYLRYKVAFNKPFSIYNKEYKAYLKDYLSDSTLSKFFKSKFFFGNGQLVDYLEQSWIDG